jgi:hypothetical protein
MDFTQNPSITRYALWKATKALDKRKGHTRAQARTWIQNSVRLVLQVAGFSLLTIAGFTWHIVAGYVIAGLSCFVFSWLAAPEPSQNDNGPQGR